jgi:D-glycero-D-manno-heptose 1,7-bisphosphate phosphatase
MDQLDNVVFLDRDGVINRDSEAYIKNWDEFHFLPGSLSAIAELNRAGMPVILITNQSGIGRGLISLEILLDIHEQMKQAILSREGDILDIFFCPHIPDDNCTCRKPRPGMVEDAREKHRINMSTSSFIGDSARDIQCARAGDCGRSILVLTGNGHKARESLEKQNCLPDLVTDNLLEAARHIISHPLPSI